MHILLQDKRNAYCLDCFIVHLHVNTINRYGLSFVKMMLPSHYKGRINAICDAQLHAL